MSATVPPQSASSVGLRVQTFIDALHESGYTGDIVDGVGARTAYGTDNSVYQVHPRYILCPRSIEDVSLIAKLNYELGAPCELVARGGATGTNGQSLTSGVVIDFKKHMGGIGDVNVGSGLIRVEAGVVSDQLNRAVADHGLRFAPNIATGSRATIGGMIATDAAGKGSAVFGRTNTSVVAIEAVLFDGTVVMFDSDGDATPRTDRVINLESQVVAALDGFNHNLLPELHRDVSGYNLGAATSETDGRIDITKLLCGSEGTLALVCAATVRLVPMQTETHLALGVYDTFKAALDDSVLLRSTLPVAIETIDETTMLLARSSPAYNSLSELGVHSPAAVLLVEYDSVEGVELLDGLETAGSFEVTQDKRLIDGVWQIRKDAVGYLGQPIEGSAAVPFVEDCAVPIGRMSEFVMDFREILDTHGLKYGMFGHADVGCIHVRPVLNLEIRSQRQLVLAITRQVAELVHSYGGVLWGEHGIGVRGNHGNLDPDTQHRMRQIKSIFDPLNILNPHKLYTPLGTSGQLLTVESLRLRADNDKRVNRRSREGFEAAFACNGNASCHSLDASDMMCPSYKVTLDPTRSPKGRADMVRGWLANPKDKALRGDLSESLNDCLSCNACTALCPVSLNIPEMKSRFGEAARSDPKTWLRNLALSRFEATLRVSSRLFSARGVVRAVERALGMVDLPVVDHESAAEAKKLMVHPKKVPGDATVIVLPDAFSSLLDANELQSFVTLAERMGEKAAVVNFLPQNKFSYVKGLRKHFARTARQHGDQLKLLESYGVPIVVLEPPASLMYKLEYQEVHPSFPKDMVMGMAEYLAANIDKIPKSDRPSDVNVFTHCNEAAMAPETTRYYQTVFEAAGHSVTVHSLTCCGRAGIYGHEKGHRDTSRALFKTYWLPKMDSRPTAINCATGYSCRSHAETLGSALLSPLTVLLEDYD